MLRRIIRTIQFFDNLCDSNNDGIGDLNGVLQKLDYICGSGNENLGCDMIWLMPVFPSPTYHKYDVIDYTDIDPQYGTLQDMKELIHACHKKNVRLILDFPISFATAALGGEVQVPTLSGPVKYRIPEGTQPGTEFRIKGAGIQQLRGSGKGDLILRIKVEIPKRLTNKQKDILRQFEETTSDREYDKMKSFMDRVKELFQ